MLISQYPHNTLYISQTLNLYTILSFNPNSNYSSYWRACGTILSAFHMHSIWRGGKKSCYLIKIKVYKAGLNLEVFFFFFFVNKTQL